MSSFRHRLNKWINRDKCLSNFEESIQIWRKYFRPIIQWTEWSHFNPKMENCDIPIVAAALGVQINKLINVNCQMEKKIDWILYWNVQYNGMIFVDIFEWRKKFKRTIIVFEMIQMYLNMLMTIENIVPYQYGAEENQNSMIRIFD